MVITKKTLFLGALHLTGLLSRTVSGDSNTGRCGPAGGGLDCLSFGTNNRCCSPSGWCGDSTAHCGAGCLSGFGNCSPPPADIPTGARTKPGNVPYGSDIFSCSSPGTIALTFDDGPFEYTSQLLDILLEKQTRATFFITGNNLGKGAIDETERWRTLIQRMYNEGHQIASHTWDHLDLSQISEQQRHYQMSRLEEALLSILGRFPTYMRPPFISCNSACRATMNALGYHIIIWDLDTDDYNNVTPELIQNSKNRVASAYASGPANGRSWMPIAHDIHRQTALNLASYMIDLGKSKGFTHVRLGECLNDPQANWYRTAM